MTDQLTTTTLPAPEWVDRSYPVPETIPAPLGRFTGAQELARQIFNAIWSWHHDVEDVAYIEETSTNRHSYDATRAIRMECTADGHRVSIRHSNDEWRPDHVWTLSIDGSEPAPITMEYAHFLHEKINSIALTAHRALTDLPT